MSPIHKKIFVAISTINQLQKLAKINNVAFENPVLPGNEIYKSLLLGNKAIEFHQFLLQFVVCLEYSLRRQKVFFLIFCLSLLLGAAAFILSLRASMYELFESSEASGSLFVNLTNGYDERSPCLQRIRIVSASSLISPSWNGLSHPKQVSRSSLSSSDACSLSLLATDLLQQALCSSLNVTFRFDMASQ